ncbi:MAG: zf-HC2 domain-containing protein [Archangium sp.]|nr:zf-HC2 domain-containing protein [Archangium sp.]MDP3158182.1 zf-HC2 domain-containing protein [Archangium sp.]MDP3572427.1 zf-HC2 domain-containing protein [Archangium sp.]
MIASNCKDSVEHLLEYLDGELNADLRAKLEAHLSGCSPCEDFWKSYSATPGLCRKALIAEMPREVATKLTDFLRLEMNKSK